MKQFVAMVKGGHKAGYLCILTPLFPMDYEQMLVAGQHHTIALTSTPAEPLAYVIDIDDGTPQVMGVMILKYLEILSEL